MLNQKERDILVAAQFQGQLSVAEIVESTGHRESVVRYHLNRFRAKGTIRPYSWINPGLLGYSNYFLFFSPAPGLAELHSQLIDYFRSSGQVWMLHRLYGDFSYMAGVYARDVEELWSFLQIPSERFGSVFYEKHVTIVHSMQIFGRTYLSPRLERICCPVRFGQTSKRVSIDEVDHKLLSSLSVDGFSSFQKLSRATGVPPSTVRFRLNRLEETGVVVKHLNMTNLDHFGGRLFRLLLQVKGVDFELEQQLAEFCQGCLHVTSLMQLVGSPDFVLRVEAEDNEQVNIITEDLYERFGEKLNTIRVLTTHQAIKCSLYPFDKFDGS